jgi:hypothetical protein
MLIVLFLGPIGGTLGTVSADMPSIVENAALQYWEAFVLMPSAKELSNEELRILKEWSKTPLTPEARQTIDKYKASLAYLRLAADIAWSSWGNKHNCKLAGPNNLTHVVKANELARAALLTARFQYNNGQYGDAFNNLFATLVLARHIANEGTLNGTLACFAIEEQVIDCTFLILDERCKRQPIANFCAQLDYLPAQESIKGILEKEKGCFIDWIQANGLDAVESFVVDLHGADDQNKRVIRRFMGIGKDCIKPVCFGIQEAYAEAIREIDLPLDNCIKCEQHYREGLKKEFFKTAGIVSVIKSHVFPPVANLKKSQIKMDMRRRLFRTALAVVLIGPAEVIKGGGDPAKERIKFEEAKHGFLLRGNLNGFKEQAIEIKVRRDAGAK